MMPLHWRDEELTDGHPGPYCPAGLQCHGAHHRIMLMSRILEPLGMADSVGWASLVYNTLQVKVKTNEQKTYLIFVDL